MPIPDEMGWVLLGGEIVQSLETTGKEYPALRRQASEKFE
jgi:hypothetical protein